MQPQYIVNQPYSEPMQSHMPQPLYEPKDVIEQYGSVVKEIFDTEKLLRAYYASLRGRKIDEQEKEVLDEDAEVYIKTERAAKEFIQLVKSKVNKHIDFSYFTENEANDRIIGSIKEINRWLMLQGEEVPLRYRSKIAAEAMALIDASYHKSTNGRMLLWTKSTISLQEGLNITHNPEQHKGGWLSNIWPFGRKSG